MVLNFIDLMNFVKDNAFTQRVERVTPESYQYSCFTVIIDRQLLVLAPKVTLSTGCNSKDRCNFF